MRKKHPQKSREAKASTLRHEHEAEAGVAGALTGAAALGGVAGPPGAVAGAVIGGVAAAVAAVLVEKNHADRAAIDREIDAEAGVSGGELGAPDLKQPSAKAGEQDFRV